LIINGDILICIKKMIKKSNMVDLSFSDLSVNATIFHPHQHIAQSLIFLFFFAFFFFLSFLQLKDSSYDHQRNPSQDEGTGHSLLILCRKFFVAGLGSRFSCFYILHLINDVDLHLWLLSSSFDSVDCFYCLYYSS